MKHLYVAYVLSDYKNHTNDFYDITLWFDEPPSISNIKDEIRKLGSFWDYGIAIVQIIDLEKLTPEQ